MGFKNLIREYFTFNRRERNGIFVLLIIILLLIIYLSFSDLFAVKSTTDFTQFEKEISEFEAAQKQLDDSISNQEKYFSGNRLTDDEGGTRSQFNEHYNNQRKDFKETRVLVELNSADTTELMKIKGIGPAFSRRIVKFRDALGGFISLRQLLEVYGFDREKFEQVVPQIFLDTSAVKRLNINTASVDDLNMHPYLSKKEAVAIFTQRVKKGDYTDVGAAKNVALMSDSAFSKVLPYLSTK